MLVGGSWGSGDVIKVGFDCEVWIRGVSRKVILGVFKMFKI